MTEHKRKEEELPSMSLGDHLEELRIRMILALAGVVVGLIVCLFFGKQLTSPTFVLNPCPPHKETRFMQKLLLLYHPPFA